ncbi:MAG: hypothetical protein IAE94_10305 [Chthoniobacterales bacterium]|nr:hypothetical protein [Chthoniobacterales bacterium]
MARRALLKDLPPLEEVFASFPGFQDGFSRQQTLINALRDCAKKLQRDQSRHFYSVREISHHFSIPLRTTALAFETLDIEGLLHRIRGAHTLLTGRNFVSRKPVNGVVGLPIWLTSMITSPFQCAFQSEMDEHLRTRGFVADTIFFNAGEDRDPDFANRLLRHNLDFLIWQSPDPLSSHVLMTVREHGIRLILIQSTESSLGIPSRNYLCDWQPAYRQMASHWKSQGIRRVLIPTPPQLLHRRAAKMLASILEEHRMEVLTMEPDEKSLSSRCARSPKASSQPVRDVLAFVDFSTADHLCNGYPDLIENLSRRSLLAFCHGPVRVPQLSARRICVDLVHLDPKELAQAVVKDLSDPRQTHEGLRKTFTAEFIPQIILKSTLDQHFSG